MLFHYALLAGLLAPSFSPFSTTLVIPWPLLFFYHSNQSVWIMIRLAALQTPKFRGRAALMGHLIVGILSHVLPWIQQHTTFAERLESNLPCHICIPGKETGVGNIPRSCCSPL